MDPFVLVYVAGYLWFWRYTVGYIVGDVVGNYGADAEDWLFGMFLGTIANAFWPVLVSGRIVYVLGKKYTPKDSDVMFKVFPGPKEIETSAERKARLEKENRLKVLEQRRAINAREHELNMTLTRWED